MSGTKNRSHKNWYKLWYKMAKKLNHLLVHRTSDKITDLETLQLQEKHMKTTIIQERMDGSIPWQKWHHLAQLQLSIHLLLFLGSPESSAGYADPMGKKKNHLFSTTACRHLYLEMQQIIAEKKPKSREKSNILCEKGSSIHPTVTSHTNSNCKA